MKSFFLIICCWFACLNAATQDSAFRLQQTYAGTITEAAVDNLDHLYVLTATDQLKKYNARGDSMAVYNNVRKFGKVHALDVSNPLKVLLFYKDFSTIVILDRLLAVRATIDLRRLNILQAAAVGLSYDNNIWVYDGYDSKLKKIDEQGNLLLETPDFRMLFPEIPSPQQIIDRNRFVHVYDSAYGLYLFDYYGTFKRKIPVTGWQAVDISDRFIIGVADKALHAYHLSTLSESQQKFPHHFAPYHRYHLSNNKLIAVSKNELHIYRFQ